MQKELLDATGEFRVESTDWYLDARFPRQRAIVSHGHSDHLGRGHALVVATPITCELIRHRLAEPGEATAVAEAPDGPSPAISAAIESIPTQLIELDYRQPRTIDDTTIEFFPAGHVLGSAMPRITTPQGRLLYTGDFRLRGDAATVPACSPPADGADAVLMECTYGHPRYRFPLRASVIEQLCEIVANAFAAGNQPVCLCYSLGKAQEIARHLCDHNFRVSMHGATHAITEIYKSRGVSVGDCIRYAAGQIDGTVLIAPPHIRRSRMITHIQNAEIMVITGWSIDSSTKYRYQADHALAISDHADFDELNEFVDLMRERGTTRFYLTHGFVTEFGRHLRGRGVNALPARPPKQLALFED
jgi:putative mRNA 3-end processing factor